MKIGLVLGGGGARGFAHLGVAKALRELGIEIGCISGTSIGSIIGGVIASDMLGRAMNWVCEPDWMKLPQLFISLHLPRKSLLGTRSIERFIKNFVCVKTFERLKIPFAAVATDFHDGTALPITSGDLYTAIRASIAIPGVFEPIERDGRVLVDGGLSNPVPVDVCRSLLGADKVIAVDVNAMVDNSSFRTLKKLNTFDILDQTFTVVSNRLSEESLKVSRPDCLLRPVIGKVKMLDFRNGSQLVDAGYQCAMAHKDELLSLANGN